MNYVLFRKDYFRNEIFLGMANWVVAVACHHSNYEYPRKLYSSTVENSMERIRTSFLIQYNTIWNSDSVEYFHNGKSFLKCLVCNIFFFCVFNGQ